MKKRKQIPQRADLGTPEAIKKRAQFGADPTMTTTPIDVLYAWGKIKPEHYSAACRLATLSKKIFGKVWPKAVDLNAVTGAEEPRDYDITEYRLAWEAVSRQGLLAKYEVERLVRLESFPGMGSTDDAENMRRYILPLRDGTLPRQFLALRDGLDALARFFERRPAVAA